MTAKEKESLDWLENLEEICRERETVVAFLMELAKESEKILKEEPKKEIRSFLAARTAIRLFLSPIVEGLFLLEDEKVKEKASRITQKIMEDLDRHYIIESTCYGFKVRKVIDPILLLLRDSIERVLKEKEKIERDLKGVKEIREVLEKLEESKKEIQLSAIGLARAIIKDGWPILEEERIPYGFSLS